MFRSTSIVVVPVLALTTGCIDEHHLDDPHHHAHHDDEHHAPQYTVLVARPAPPSQPPVPGPGHWVWDDTRQNYIWVSEGAQP